MAENQLPIIGVHDDPDLFRETLNFTATQTSFPARLIEKDYFCTVLLAYLGSIGGQSVFKGGTCLAKVHGSFYRLSEDLDFAIPMPATASRSERGRRVRALKNALNKLAESIPCFRVTAPLVGANDSAQYIGAVSYASSVTRQDEPVSIEISLREPLLMPTVDGPVHTMLLDPVSGQEIVRPVGFPCIAKIEAFAEKYRAALTRREVAIRDFYDLDYAVRKLEIRPEDVDLVELVELKLAVPGNDPINIGPSRLAQLRGQLDARLKPVLRDADLAAFDLDRAFNLVSEMAGRLSESR
ncbi:MAG TPA: nucleotidyl transferase AbiEii/AbiGii toxin family protein [Phycisphaerae bacterium]|nr:nucleotidyl transferase AbiEii/AbiGii toxin family protein [Phycisphaerae bacterium]HRY71498.1 nucleotidyl transferase AbiEii/AbiGii toxin family protein [Phycisphaerae bacterium]HSA29921.1 nucleotidyl transferase AbiEii/AbiGii toxin family protein [Phycisphaerae bacterium]